MLYLGTPVAHPPLDSVLLYEPTHMAGSAIAPLHVGRHPASQSFGANTVSI